MANAQKIERLDAEVRAATRRMTPESWNSFVEELMVPGELMPALMTMRPELVKLAQARPMTAEEVAVIYRLVAGLIETNIALRDHARTTAQLVDQWADAFSALRGVGHQIQQFANFQAVGEEG